MIIKKATQGKITALCVNTVLQRYDGHLNKLSKSISDFTYTAPTS